MDPSALTSPEALKSLTKAYAHLLASKYHVLASTIMLCYDHILTFDDELKYFWQRKTTFPFWLFLTFRYASPIVSIINLVASHEPNWVGDACKNWIWLPIAIGSIIRFATGIIMILRVHAVYAEATWVLWLMLPIFIGHLVVMGWAIPAGGPANLPPGFIGCIPKPKAGTGLRLPSIYIAALVFDATVFALTLGRAIYYRASSPLIPLMTLVIRDGTLYFAVIFVVNLTNGFMMALAPPDLSVINAPFASMIRTILVSRLMFNLRAAADTQVVSCSSRDPQNHIIFSSHGATQTLSTFGAVGRTPTFFSWIGADEFAVPLPDKIFKLEDPSAPWVDDGRDMVEEYEMQSVTAN
ncbi:hypothetical protein E1B28_013313 [Marasmius oreades]|uniref:DUF6533 domain-containing protein n=1 Tax=Marasmius oreades TaxID=181124 RepID=A0A9P7RPZ8_9AGAR|nr:uncharacterized protein E1B28_013313 [Marasmius oreades]KAG7087337.1 hypothetical protein E1B28_013313 [Marasmius oreades]